MATRSDDPKLRSLRDTRSLNPHPEKVADATFLREEFFDARDAVQVKYEMVRAVVVDGDSVTEATARFGYSRPAYYQALTALAQSGLAGLAAAKPGPRSRHKLSEEVLAWAQGELDADPARKPAGLVDPIVARFGIRVHPRSIERALAWRREQSKSR